MTTDAIISEPRLSQSVHLLLDRPTRSAVLGLALIAAKEAGPSVRPKEGETLRGLIESALDHIRSTAPQLYARALAAGTEELAARATPAGTPAK